MADSLATQSLFLRRLAAHLLRPRSFVSMTVQDQTVAILRAFDPQYSRRTLIDDVTAHTPALLDAAADVLARLAPAECMRIIEASVRLALADGLVDAWDRQVLSWAATCAGVTDEALAGVLRCAQPWQVAA
jgi:hypothetical protein